MTFYRKSFNRFGGGKGQCFAGSQVKIRTVQPALNGEPFNLPIGKLGMCMGADVGDSKNFVPYSGYTYLLTLYLNGYGLSLCK